MKKPTRALLFLAGAAAGGMAGAYVVLRQNREKIDRAARTSREVADQAERIAAVLEKLSDALGAPGEVPDEEAEIEVAG